LIITLSRLRKTALLLKNTQTYEVKMMCAIEKFDKQLPNLRRMRNVGEHVDSYGSDSPKRHDLSITRKGLQVGSWDGATFIWLSCALNIDEALKSANELFGEMKACRDWRLSTNYKDKIIDD
jgi:hypothetical protein